MEKNKKQKNINEINNKLSQANEYIPIFFAPDQAVDAGFFLDNGAIDDDQEKGDNK